MKSEKGITMVSLIVTIIVMLILAGTVIAISISGDDGVIKKAKDAKEVEDYSLYETLTETVVTSKKKNGKVNFESLQNKLEAIDNTINCTYDSATSSCSVELGDKTYTVSEYGSITEQ